MAKKVKRRIRRRRGSGPSNMYFNKDTQAAIVEYQESESQSDREKLYVDKIMPAFTKLAENLIFIYGFIKPGEQYENLRSDCVSFLYETIHKWDESKGSKAFSYFNVVAKNWLIINSRRNTKRNRRHVSIDAPELMSRADKVSLEHFDVIPPPDEIMISATFRTDIMTLLKEIQRRVHGENEVKCINAVITVFDSIDDLDFLNKRAVFVYVRDISGLTPKQLSVAMSIIRKHYRELVHTGGEYDIF